MSRKRSMVWRFFRTVDSQSVKCVLCRGYQARYVQGSTTTAMLRHLRVKHPKEVAKKCKGRAPGAVPRNVNQDVEMDSERYCFVEVLLEDEDSDIHTTLDKSNMNGIREPTQENPAEQLRHVGVSDNHSVRQGRHQRSLIWRHFERLDSSNACCRICMRKLQCSEGSTSNLHRHMSKRHPELFAKLVPGGLKPPPSRSSQGLTANGDASTPAEIVGSTEQGQISVEVLLEDEDSDIHTTLDKSNMNGIREPTQENPAEQLRHVGVSDNHSVRQGRHQRSLIWRHFVPLDSSNAVCCRICMRKLQCSEGSTSNLHRHMSKRHPELFAKLSGLKPPPSRSSQGLTANGDTSTPAEIVGSTEQGQISVDMLLEDEDPDIHTTMDESDISSAINGILESAQEDPAEQIGHGEASDDHSVSQGRHQRSLIWRHFERLNSLNAARCRICMRKLQCFDGGSTSNLHRHMSKRHPELFAKLSGLKPPPSSLSHGLTANGDTSTPAKIVGSTEQGQISGVLKGTRPFLRQKRVLKRERELIEALRRTQKEEARTLEHQRELLEKLRAANAREAAAEREEIESLRKAQQEEAKELNAQREELQREKAELQKKWEELQQLACTI